MTADGTYRLQSLVPGAYDLSIILEDVGHQKKDLGQIQVEPEQQKVECVIE